MTVNRFDVDCCGPVAVPDHGLTNEKAIGAFMHCALCVAELPRGMSPRKHARLEVGWTRPGLQVWCLRHGVDVVHIDLEGQRHPANASRASRKAEKVSRARP